MALPSIASIALRSVPGAFILNSGIGKVEMDEGTAGYFHTEAVKGIPALAEMESRQFGKLVALGEIAVGGALLLPFVPNRLAGLALGGFSAGMLSIYFRDPEKTEEDGVRPSGAGIDLAKASWMAAIAVALIAGVGSVGGSGDKKKRKK